MKPRTVRLPDRRVWLRVAHPDWIEPLDPSYAMTQGGRWNAPDSHRTLYLNADVLTARRRIARMLEGSPVRVEDLDDTAYVLVAARLPRAQRCADAATDAGLAALGLPVTYPRDLNGRMVDRGTCQEAGGRIRGARLRGVWCRSVAAPDAGCELAWFPASVRSRARPAGKKPLPFGRWRHAVDWADLGLAPQVNPR